MCRQRALMRIEELSANKPVKNLFLHDSFDLHIPIF